jgi:alpha-beta hydrolase superfamily lysophospholipase
MIQEENWFECDDGAKLFLRRWIPEQVETKAVLHIAHGMAEHGLRYKRLAEKLTANGIEVWVADQRGHGKTADLSVNEQGRGGRLGHCADKGTFDRVAADVYAINQAVRKAKSGVPLFLFGHSWGSFIVQNYIEKYQGDIDGCILSGTRGPGGVKVAAGKHVFSFIAMLRGKRKGSLLAHVMSMGPHNRPFKPNRTKYDWISRDEQEVDAYANDPLCGFLCSSGFYRDLICGLYQIHRLEAMSRIKQSLPIYVFSGSEDPVGEMGAGPTVLVNQYRSLGVKDLEFVLYPGARHETINETNREEVTDNLLSWINRHCDAPAKD